MTTSHDAAMRLGVDTGGTFTDFVWLDAGGQWRIHKTLSTPANPADAILSGIDAQQVPDHVPVVHGSTVATNALLERRGATTALITTAGFEDVLAIGRQNRPDIYALVPQKPPPLVPRALRFGVPERVDAAGAVIVPLDLDAVDAIERQMRDAGVEAVAVALLFSFLHPAHEEAIAARLRELAGDRPLHISLSSAILPEYREYERTATTVINAYVAPLMGRYLNDLARRVAPRPLTVMQSSGGVISAATAGREAARTCLSGPAGGVVGARYVAAAAGYEAVITFDMGGTSTDVALLDGRLPTTSSGAIADLPLRLPIIDIHTVGAGGGSLAQVDPGGALHVGPQSAGADPGPAAYGRGGELPTTTDANLVTGRLDADHFLGGAMRLDGAAAHAALQALADAMGAPSAAAAALGVLQVANATMERAIRRISVERGHDPRRFTLLPFGGAGPLHACDLAASLRIPQVLIPAAPGVLSALGLLVAAPARDFSQTVLLPLPDDGSGDRALQAAFAPLADRARAEMAAEGFAATRIVLRRAADMRYAGQSHELAVDLTADEDAAPAALFHAAHERRYGYRQSAQPEVVTLRVTATLPTDPPALVHAALVGPDAAAAVVGRKPVWFGRQPLTTILYDRRLLLPGNRFRGPAIVFQYDTTTVIPPGWEAFVDGWSNLLLTAGAAS